MSNEFWSGKFQAASSYVAAVVEFHPLGSTFQQNVQKYVDLIVQATTQVCFVEFLK
jgi:hypothetical protein